MEKEKEKETKKNEDCFYWCFSRVFEALLTVGSTRFYLGLKGVRSRELEEEISELERMAAETLQKMQKTSSPKDKEITDFLDETFFIWMRIVELQLKVKMLAEGEGRRNVLPIELIDLN